jgi:CBS-domain-containing membrane protein
MDWLAFGLPFEGSAASEPSLGDLIHGEAPRCSPDERLQDVAARMTAGWTWCAVVNEAGILLGRLRGGQLDEIPDATAEEAMDSGPSTYRPSAPATELAVRMKSGRLEAAFVTDSDGRLWGLVSRTDLERALGGGPP